MEAAAVATTSSAPPTCATGTIKAILSPRTRSYDSVRVPTSNASSSATYSSANTDSRRIIETSSMRSQKNTTKSRYPCAPTSPTNILRTATEMSIRSSNDSTAQFTNVCPSKLENKPAEAEEADMHTWRLCPMPYSYALIAVLAVLLYSIAFLFYAQRHKLVLFIMTGLIAISIVMLYIFGVLSLLYMMHRISQMEKCEEEVAKNPEEKWWPADSSSTSNSSSKNSDSVRSQLSADDMNADLNPSHPSPARPPARPCARSQQLDRLQPFGNHQSPARYSNSKCVSSDLAISLQQSPDANKNGLRKAIGEGETPTPGHNISML